ncbi:MAG: hypothetical protein WB791_03565 [Waddliaceae bacterium]
MRTFYLYLACFFVFLAFKGTCGEAERKEHIFVNHVKTCIEAAECESSKLNPEVLKIAGMSNAKVRHLLNRLCTLSDSVYFEIGLWKGSTFIAALYGNENYVIDAIGVDNWSKFGGPKKEFFSNCARFLPHLPYRIYSNDSFTLQKSLFKYPVTIYFYDGDHSELNQEKAFTYFNDIFDDVFIAIVDDWNRPHIPRGTFSAFKKLGYKILYERILPSTEQWWNGLYIAVIQKQTTPKKRQ